MNKKIIALAVAAAATSSLASAAEVYNENGTKLNIGGRAEFRGDFIGKSSGEEIEGTMSDASRFRLNVGGETQITEELTGFGFYEGEQRQSADLKQRYTYAGLKGNFGAVSFGRQDTAAVQISNMSDMTTFTGGQKAFIDASNEQQNNTIAYTGEFGGLNLQASYIAGEEKDSDGYGVSAVYTLDMGLGFGFGYSAEGEGDNGVEGNAMIAGINYELGGLYLGATYTMGDTGDNEDEEFTGMELAAVYDFSNGFALKGAYQNSEIDGKSSSYTKSDFFEITGDYRFNKNLNAYVSYMLNNLDQDDMNNLIGTGYSKDAENTLRFGLKYSF
ncbi:porin [Vibrio sp. JC009]|uniref:porin n=1 Tax=Vibrio sp. JC009 TaxID=2912314 RepID=UPI0023AF6566|nr:porin [Vibrio sp. JC009]WED22422.1 porin [Vibrio sp. JC009]